MKEIRLRHCNGVDLNRVFSAKLVGGVRGFDDAMAIETYSNTCAPTLRTLTGFIVINQIIETDMKKRDFHRHCRVVYRAMRKQYGKEKVQDECLRVFKVFFPLLHKARTTEEYGFDELSKERTRKVFESWNVREGGELDLLLGNILNRMEEPFTKEEFIRFCEDSLVVVMRIRKLTNVECYRLQGVSEKDIDTLLSSGISKSAHYKLAGNSITSGGNHCDSQGNWDGPLFNLFRKIFIETEPDVVKGEVMQLSLF